MEDTLQKAQVETPVNYTGFPLVPVGRLKPHPDNPNYHPKVQIDALSEVIRENGWRAPVVVSNLSGYVIKGHGRIAAATQCGWDVPVQYQDYPDEAAEARDLIADNKIQELSSLDAGTVAALVAKFKLSGGLGFPGQVNGVLAKTLESVKAKAPEKRKYPILILENEEQYEMFEELKDRYGAKTDAALFGKILKKAFSAEVAASPLNERKNDA